MTIHCPECDSGERGPVQGDSAYRIPHVEFHPDMRDGDLFTGIPCRLLHVEFHPDMTDGDLSGHPLPASSCQITPDMDVPFSGAPPPEIPSLQEPGTHASSPPSREKVRIYHPEPKITVDLQDDPFGAPQVLMQDASRLTIQATSQTVECIEELEMTTNAFDAYVRATGSPDEADFGLLKELKDIMYDCEESTGEIQQLAAVNE